MERRQINFEINEKSLSDLSPTQKQKFVTTFDSLPNKTEVFRECVKHRIVLFENDDNYFELLNIIKQIGIHEVLGRLKGEKNESLNETMIENMVLKIMLKNGMNGTPQTQNHHVNEKKKVQPNNAIFDM